MIKVLLIIIFLIPSALAISADFKETYQPSETLIVEISGNILEPIEKEDIELKRKNVLVPFEYDVKRIGKKYFLWAIVPEQENNYSLYINGIVTTQNGKVTETDFIQNFSVSGNIIEYNIKPGFAIIKDQNEIDFTISLNQDIDTTITVNFPEEREIILKPGNNEITFSIENIASGIYNISIGKYTLPVGIIKESEKKEIIETSLPDFRFNPRVIESIVLTGKDEVFPFVLVNSGTTVLENIVFDYNTDLFLITPEPGDLSAGEEKEFTIIPQTTNPAYGEVVARSGDLFSELEINLSYTKIEQEAETPYQDEDYEETLGYYCTDLGGKICVASDVCSAEAVKSLDSSNCCLGNCKVSKEKKGSSVIGYLIAGILILILVIVFVKYRKTKKQRDPLMEKLAKQ